MPDLENSISVQHVTPSLPSLGIVTREDDSLHLLLPLDAKTFVGEASNLVLTFQSNLPNLH